MQIFFLQLGPYSVPPGSLILLSSYTMAMDPTIFYKPDLVLPGQVSSELTLMKPSVFYVAMTDAFAQRDGSVGQMESLELDRHLPLFPSAMDPEAA